MKKRVIGGLILSIIGLSLIIESSSITGFAILDYIPGNTRIFSLLGLGLFIGGILMMSGLESKTENEEVSEERHLAHNASQYEKLKARLAFFEDKTNKGKISVYGPGKVERTGVQIDNKESEKIRNVFLKYIPVKYATKDIEILVTGSLSKARCGKRSMEKIASQLKEYEYPHETHSKKGLLDYSKDEILSDEFYESDLDMGIVSHDLYEYIKKVWPDGLDRSTYSGIGTINITSDYKKMGGAFATAPKWLRNLVSELQKTDVLNKRRTINFRIFGKEPGNNPKRDIIYKV